MKSLDRSTNWREGMSRDPKIIVASFDGCKAYVAVDGSVLIGKCRHKRTPTWGRLTEERCPDCPFARFTLVPVMPAERLHTSTEIGHG
jgi:hypothetical protein